MSGVEGSTGYCPYCNDAAIADLTDEHVIPQSIGGDSRTVIKVCERCNNTVGSDVDRLLSSNGWLRLNALFAGGIAKRQDRLATKIRLKDGTELEGDWYFLRTEAGVVPGFQPKKHQPDGSVWLSEHAVKTCETLPSGTRVFTREMVEYWGFYCPPAKLSRMEAAIVKILLGIIYMDQGRSVVSSAAFDVLRNSLRGNLDPAIEFSWLDEPMAWGDSVVRNHEHAVYFECTDTRTFRAGVALFGTGARIAIDNFNCFLPRRCVRWPGRSGPSDAANC